MGNVLRWQDDFNWESVPVLAYKEEGNHFRSITRQVLFEGDHKLPVQWRYFEIAEGGNSTLERHEHEHVVMIIRGKGKTLVGDRVEQLNRFDMLHIPSMTWHQFRATEGEPFGFLCLVNIERDRPQLPDETALAELESDPEIAGFIRY
jgi:quercetin dioxygenase-like cupin family protein